MQKARLYLTIFAGIVFLQLGLSCSNPGNISQKPIYFAWKQFLETEIKRLQASKAIIRKSIILNGKKEEKTLSQVDFEHELSLFFNADLNKSAYATSYDNLSENNLIWYSLKKDENLKVKKVLIKLDLAEVPEDLELIVEEKNILFSTEKKLHMHFVEGKLASYSIDGTQQLAWLAPTSYKMLGVVLAK